MFSWSNTSHSNSLVWLVYSSWGLVCSPPSHDCIDPVELRLKWDPWWFDRVLINADFKHEWKIHSSGGNAQKTLVYLVCATQRSVGCSHETDVYSSCNWCEHHWLVCCCDKILYNLCMSLSGYINCADVFMIVSKNHSRAQELDRHLAVHPHYLLWFILNTTQ